MVTCCVTIEVPSFRLPAALCVGLFICSSYSLPAQKIQRLDKPIEFDGKISKGEWGGIDTISFVSHWPTYIAKPNTKTEFRLAYDDKYLYFSGVCYDNPKLIQAPYFERDMWTMSMDQITLFLDTYNDNENGLVFAVTPTGSRIDVSMKNDAQGDSPADVSWNSYWQAEVSKIDSGWSAEVRLPFSSLRFQPVNDQVTMGLIVYRYVARNRQLDIYPSIPAQWGFWSFLKPSKATDITFHGIKNKRPWFTSPYLLTRLGYHHNKVEETATFEKIDDDRITAGLDIQHALTDNMNLDITVNTDFAQVEADDQIVNLSRFSFFFPEKRRFFLERSSIMDFGFENNNKLFYSRRIGINNGVIVPLWGGARLVGRVGKYDVGFLNMQSQEKEESPSENFGVLRLRRRVSKNNSYVGGIFTSRTDFTGATNLSYGIDGIINLFKNDYLKVNLAQTWNSMDSVVYRNTFEDRNRIYVMWENRSQVGFNYSISYSQVDQNYSPGLGFEARNNFKSIGDKIAYGWFPKKRGTLRYVSATLNSSAFYPNNRSGLESFLLAPTFLVEWVKNNSLQLTATRFYDRTSSEFNLSNDIVIPAGTYVNRDVALTYQSPSVNFLSSQFTSTIGTFYGGNRFSAAITPICIFSKYLTVSGFYQYNHISFPGSVDYVAHVGRLKVSTSLNVKLSVNAFVQLNSLTKVSALNFRLRYNWKDGNDLFIVYNELLNNNGRTEINLPFSDYRAFMVKYIYTFHFGS